ncbi:MAG: thioesterase domain-containing protein [Candidatus Aminicenantes bacterium]|nr:thioesterase domain-containing protein [Candidatus Aminicenantes bacterium]
MSHRKWKLYCFPYAGGAAAIFNPWKKYLDKEIELPAVELAGRGKRIYDPLYNSMDEAVEDVYQQIKNDLHNSPFGFFGHSMGCIIAFELAHKLREKNAAQPSFIFFSGRGAPHVPEEKKEIRHTLPENEFKEKILELGGTPRDFFEHPELLEVLLPMLRCDFKIAETYRNRLEVKPFDYPINVMIGRDEDVTAEQMHGWKDHTNKICTLHYFMGGHFFINEYVEQIVEIINQSVRQLKKIPKT